MLCGALNATPERQLGSEAVLRHRLAHRHKVGNRDFPPRSSSLLPSSTPCRMQPLAASRQACCWGWQRTSGTGDSGRCHVTGVVQDMMHGEDFQLLAINKVYAALGRFLPNGCQQTLSLLNVLCKWSLLFCLQNVQGVITGKRKVMSKGILLFREQHRIFYECWFLCWFCS